MDFCLRSGNCWGNFNRYLQICLKPQKLYPLCLFYKNIILSELPSGKMKAFLKISGWHFFFLFLQSFFCKVYVFISHLFQCALTHQHAHMGCFCLLFCSARIYIFLSYIFSFENLLYVKCNTNLNCIILWLLTNWNLCNPNHFHDTEHYNQPKTLHIGITCGASARCQLRCWSNWYSYWALGLCYGMFQGSPGDSNG